MLHKIISQNDTQFRPVITFNNETPILTAGVNTIIDSILFFNVYKASDFTTVTCDKTYFVIYATDHDSGPGGVYWGKANNLNFSDFEELGLIVDGNQAETPWLINIPEEICGDNEILHLYYHTNDLEAGNDNIQQTRLITTTGGLLHSATWTDRGRPLGVEAGENHTGYFKCFMHPTDIIRGMHLTVGGTSAEYKFSTSANGRTFTRDGVVNLTNEMPAGYELKASFGNYFKIYERNWFIGSIEPFVSNVFFVDKKCIIALTDSDYNITELIAELPNIATMSFDSIIIDETAHVYWQNPNDLCRYATINLNLLTSYI